MSDSVKQDAPNTTLPKPEKFLGVRHVVYTLLFTGIVISFGARSVLNVAVIAMISDDPPDESVPTYPEWASKKNIMLSSFIWGYICFQVGAGQIAKNYGPKLFLGGAIFISSLFTILTPAFGAWFGYGGVIASRVIQGMTQGFLFPSVHNLLSSWTPISERTKIGSTVYAGGPLGNVLVMPITGAISASTAGWPVSFYLYGGLGIAWSIVWMLIGSDSPSKHKKISEAEKAYIEVGLIAEEKESIRTPWKSILTSLPFWAIMVSYCGSNWGYWTLLTEIPSYMDKILGFKIASDSLLSALPYLVQWLLSFVATFTANLIIVQKKLSLGTTRKLYNSIGLFIPALALIALNFVSSTQKEAIVAILVVAVALGSFTLCGFQVNHIDISPVHAGTLMGITNTVANVTSILAPLAVDALKAISGYEETEKSLWNLVFSLAAGVYIAAASFYVYAASGVVQPWDHTESDEENKTHS